MTQIKVDWRPVSELQNMTYEEWQNVVNEEWQNVANSQSSRDYILWNKGLKAEICKLTPNYFIETKRDFNLRKKQERHFRFSCYGEGYGLFDITHYAVLDIAPPEEE